MRCHCGEMDAFLAGTDTPISITKKNLWPRDEPPTIDADRLMPDTLMPITLMPVTIHAHEALLMPVTFDARHF